MRDGIKENDLCKTCKHYWLDFSMPLDHYVPHCEIVDEKVGWEKMDDAVPFPCLNFPMPLGHYVPHCEIVDERIGWEKMDDAVPFPCLKCPFNCYSNKN